MRASHSVDAGQLADARKTNDALRASMCHRVLIGEITVLDYIYAAVADERLRRQSLTQLISSQAETGYKAAQKIVRATHRTIFPDRPVRFREMTVGWLVSDWSKGRRFEAFLDAYSDPRRAAGQGDLPWNFGEVRRG